MKNVSRNRRHRNATASSHYGPLEGQSSAEMLRLIFATICSYSSSMKMRGPLDGLTPFTAASHFYAVLAGDPYLWPLDSLTILRSSDAGHGSRSPPLILAMRKCTYQTECSYPDIRKEDDDGSTSICLTFCIRSKICCPCKKTPPSLDLGGHHCSLRTAVFLGIQAT